MQSQLAHVRSITPEPFSAALHPTTCDELEAIVSAAYDASLRINEGRATRVRLVVVPESEAASMGVVFDEPIPLDGAAIADLAPAAYPHARILIGPTGNGTLAILGIARGARDLHNGFGVRIFDPGVLSLDVPPYAPCAVVRGRNSAIVNSAPGKLMVELQRALFPEEPEGSVTGSNELARVERLCAEIAAARHGGTLLLVPDADDLAGLSSFPRRFRNHDLTVPQVIREQNRTSSYPDSIFDQVSFSRPQLKQFLAQFEWRNPSHPDDLRRLALYAACDGAVVMTRTFEVLGFGAKIAARRSPHVRVADAEGDKRAKRRKLDDLGGTRHQSGARFVAANRRAAALVISQDGHISFMRWDSRAKAVLVTKNVQWWV